MKISTIAMVVFSLMASRGYGRTPLPGPHPPIIIVTPKPVPPPILRPVPPILINLNEEVIPDSDMMTTIPLGTKSHVPFPIVDPGTNEPVAASTVFTLPNGKTITAGEYYEKLNALEYTLNDKGVSLRQTKAGMLMGDIFHWKGSDYRAPDAPDYAQQQTDLYKGLKPITNYSGLTTAGMTQTGSVSTGVCAASVPEVHVAQPASRTVGGEKFGAYFQGKLTFDGTASDVTGTAAGAVGFNFFKRKKDLLRAETTSHATTSNANYSTDLFVLGMQIYKFDDQGKSVKYSTPVDSLKFPNDIKGPIIRFMAGPIPMSIKTGVKTEVGLFWGVESKVFSVGCGINAFPGGVGVFAIPSARADAYLEGGVDAVFAEAGVGADLTLVDANVSVNGSVGLQPQKNAFAQYFSIDPTIEALKGRMYAYVRLVFPFFVPVWPPWGTTGWDANLFDWKGFKAGGNAYRYAWNPNSGDGSFFPGPNNSGSGGCCSSDGPVGPLN